MIDWLIGFAALMLVGLGWIFWEIKNAPELPEEQIEDAKQRNT
jgi:hypothetical protein